jgi:Helicase conserved C-terminal domain
MPNLAESLQGRDLGHLCIIAELWGIELKEQDIPSALVRINSHLIDSARVEKMVNSLPSDVKDALSDLVRSGGRLPWPQYARIYGEVREMGVAKRDREKPYKQPISVVETLWYSGFLARAFFDTPTGPEEFAYIPEDLLGKIPHTAEINNPVMGRQASALEYAHVALANDHILDHSCTLLAAKRLGIVLTSPFSSSAGEELTPAILSSILSVCGLLEDGKPVPEPVRVFLEASRGDALVGLARSWKGSTMFNELRLLPNLIAEGKWKNDPLYARDKVLGYLASIPTGIWWSMPSFIAAIKQRDPDFQRPAGDYDSWFILDRSKGEFLRGYENWEAVDGRLIRFILAGPLHWLGILDLASADSSQEVTAFRLSAWSHDLLNGKPPRGLLLEDAPIVVRSDARVGARRLVPRRVRYQVARFCEWVKETPDEYQYQISSASLVNARKQGLTVSQLLALLNRNAKAVPPSLVKALERWDKNGSEARLEKMVILRVTSAEVLQALRKSRAGRFLGEPLGPTTIAIKAGATQKVLNALAELGYLGEMREEVESS